MKTKNLPIVLILCSWILPACQPAQTPPTAIAASATIAHPTDTPLLSNTLTPSLTPAQTLTLTFTPTPEPMKDFYTPILTYMVEHTPNFADDFSQATTTDMWGKDSDGHLFSSMTRDYSLQVYTRDRKFPTNGLLNSADFVMSFEYALVSQDSFTHVFRASWDETKYYQFKYSRGGNWSIRNNNGTEEITLQTGNFQPIQGSESNFNPDTGDIWSAIPTNIFLFVVKDENLAIFINDQLVVEYNMLASFGDKNYFIPVGDGHAKMTNLKLWRLTNVDFNQ